MFKLINCGHSHNTVHEAKVCIGLIAAPAPVKPYAPPVPYKDQPGTMTEAQAAYLRRLGARPSQLLNAHGVRLSMNEASKLIEDFQKGRAGMVAEFPPEDPRLKFIEGMIDMIPDGYFATQKAEGEAVTFMRISTPKTGRFKGSKKFQTQHGCGMATTGRLEEAAVYWPSGRWSVYKSFIIEPILMVVADPTTTALLYSTKIGRCCRCNALLTDPRSRHYGIGPECEEHWPHIIARVNEEKGVFTG